MSSIYFHIPYCIRKCSYCDFNSFDNPEISREYYVDLLINELCLNKHLRDTDPLQTIYFGGGTPSLLSPPQISALIKTAKHNCDVDKDAEITLEANPGTVTAKSLDGYLAAGVNRLSIGVQSLDDRLLALLGRISSAEDAVNCFNTARRAGFNNISIDLMHSLPGQNLVDWQSTLDTAISLSPEHISAYGLSVEAGTPFARMSDQGYLNLPDEELSLEMFQVTSDRLVHAGYEHYEISNFALPNCRSRHNQVYWNRGNYLGFGAGAHSFLKSTGFGCRWENPASLPEYESAINNISAPENVSLLSRWDAMSEFMFLGLRLLEGVDMDEFAALFSLEIEGAFPGVIKPLLDKGVICIDNRRLKLSEKGLTLANCVMMEFV